MTILTYICAIFQLVIILPSSEATPTHESTLFSTAQIHFEKGNYKEAAEHYEKIVNEVRGKTEHLAKSHKDQLVQSLFNLATCYQNLRDYSKAVQIFQVLVTDYRTLQVAAQAQLTIGNVYYIRARETGERTLYSKAYESYGEVLWWPPNPFTDDALFNQALVSYSVGDYAQAYKILHENSECFQSCPKKFPHPKYPGNTSLLPKYLWLKAEIAMAEEKYEEALSIFSLIAREYPKSEYYKDAVIKMSSCRQILEQQKMGSQYLWKKEAELMLYKAERLFSNKKYRQAIDAYRYFVSKYPNHEKTREVLTNLGFCYYFLSLDYEARAVFSFVTRKYTKHDNTAAIYYQTGLCCWRQQKYAKAAEWFAKIVKHSEDDKYINKALYKKGWCEYILRDYPSSTNSFEQFLERVDKGWQVNEVLLCLADIYYSQKDYEKAALKYNEILANLSRDASNYGGWEVNKTALEKASYLIPWCKYQTNQPEEALTDFQTFVARFRDSYRAPTALDKIGEILIENQSYTEAAQTYEKLIQNYPKSKEGQGSLIKLGKTLSTRNKYPEAARILTELLESCKDIKLPLQHYAWIAKAMGEGKEHEAAVAAYKAIITHYPEDPLNELALYRLANYAKKKNNFEQAIEHIEVLLKRFPKTGFFFEANFSLGDLRKQIGRYDEAIEAYREILRFAQNALDKIKAEYNIGDCFYVRKKYRKALASYQRVALLYRPHDRATEEWIAKCLYRSVECFERTGQKEKAKEACEQFLEKYPDDPKATEVKRYRASLS